MSNKATLQEHNTQLQDNIDLIQQAIDKTKELPDASSDGSAATGTCTLRFELDTGAFIYRILYPIIGTNGNTVWKAYRAEKPESLITIENVVINQFVRFECDITDETIAGHYYAIPDFASFTKELTQDDKYGYWYFVCTEANETSLVRINLVEY